jgi:serine/threonine protein kinase
LGEKDMYRNFGIMNEAMIRLLTNGIVPLTAKNFNHYDIKYANILMAEDGHARLIDWGLASENDGLRVPEAIQDRSIAFNMPFSDIFFNSFVKQWLPEALNEIKSSPMFHNKTAGQAELLKIVAVNMINKSIEKNGEGHYHYITNDILHDIYKIYAIKNSYNQLDYNVLSYNVLIDYVQAVLLTFVDANGNFNDTKYFYDVFAKNVDIWGFLLSYVPMIEFGLGHFHIDIINGVCRILLKYCFSTEFAIKAIDVAQLVLDLRSLTMISNDIGKKFTNRIMRSSMNKTIRQPANRQTSIRRPASILSGRNANRSIGQDQDQE